MQDDRGSARLEIPGALEGLRVLDFSAIMAGPYATRWLSDMGAEVVKIEPIEGEMMRSSEPRRQGHSAYFGALNAGKRSVALDLKDKQALNAVYGKQC
ncbi:MAG: CoA transferase [Janthinobacterium lividum]